MIMVTKDYQTDGKIRKMDFSVTVKFKDVLNNLHYSLGSQNPQKSQTFFSFKFFMCLFIIYQLRGQTNRMIYSVSQKVASFLSKLLRYFHPRRTYVTENVLSYVRTYLYTSASFGPFI